MPQYDLAIKGGTVIDGMRHPRYVADIGVIDGKIATIGKIRTGDAKRVLDATGQFVVPGFIDLHTHYDSQIYWDPWCTISGWHGVTSVAIGNCGFGFAPVKPSDRERAMLSLSRNEAVPLKTMQAGMPWDWETFPEFMDSLDRHPKGVNVLAYTPLSPLMMYVMGSAEEAKSRRPTAAEMAEMCRLLEESLMVGSVGLSAQVLGEDSGQRDYDGTPMITDVMALDDLYEFAEVLAKVGRGMSQFMGGGYEMHERVADISGRPVIYNLMTPSNLLTGNRDQHGRLMEANNTTIAWLRDCNAQGRRIYSQVLVAKSPFHLTLRDTNQFDFERSQLWRDFGIGTPDQRRAKMEDPEWREQLKADFDLKEARRAEVRGKVDRGEATARDLQEAASFISDIPEWVVQNQAVYGGGLRVSEICEKRGGAHPIDVMLDVTLETDLEAVFQTPSDDFDIDEMRLIANADYSIPGVSDGGAHTKFITLGAYTTEFLCDSVRDAGVMSLEDAHWRLSGYAARAAGLSDNRGWLIEGAPADILVYDLEGLGLMEPERAYDFPADEWRLVRKARGYTWTIVNGRVTFEDGECTGDTPGRLLRAC